MTELPDVGMATGTASLAWLLFALPALGALVLLLAGRRADGWGHWLGVATVAASFVVGVLVFLDTLALVTFARVNGNLDGQVAAFFVMVVAAAEVVVGLAIIMSIFRTRRTASVDDANLLKY